MPKGNRKPSSLIPITGKASTPTPPQGPSVEQVEVMVSRNNRANEQLVQMLTDTVKAQSKVIEELNAKVAQLTPSANPPEKK
jgi:hypothetical protein